MQRQVFPRRRRASGEKFGLSIVIHGDRILIGAEYHGGTNIASLYDLSLPSPETAIAFPTSN